MKYKYKVLFYRFKRQTTVFPTRARTQETVILPAMVTPVLVSRASKDQTVKVCYVMLCYVMLWCVMNFVPSYSQWDFNCSISTWSPFQELKSIYSFRKRRGRQFNFSENKNKQCTNPRQDNSSSFKSPSVFKSPVGAFQTPAEMAEFAKNLRMRLSASVFLDTKETTVKVTAVME